MLSGRSTIKKTHKYDVAKMVLRQLKDLKNSRATTEYQEDASTKMKHTGVKE
jgi:hypothetical protein